MTELPEPLRVIEQNLLDCRISPIEVYEVPETSLTAEILDEFLGETPALQSIGLSAVYSPKRLLVSLAIASRSRVLLVKMKEKPSSQVLEDRKLLQDRILCNEHGTCHAFDIAPLAMALFHSHGIKISNGVDLQYVFREEAQSRNPNDAISAATRIRNYSVNRENVVRAFDSDVDDRKTTSWITHAAQRAWIASLLSTFTDLEDKLRDIPRVNTAKLSDEHLKILSQQSHGDARSYQQQPVSIKHDLTAGETSGRKGKIRLERFQNRIHGDGELSLTVRDRETGKTINVSGRTIDKSGRAVVVKTKGLLEGREIVSASTEMRDAPTAADRKKAEILLLQLMSQVQIFDNPFIQTIWPGGESTDVIWPNPPPTSSTLPTIVTNLSINDSQQAAIEDMLTLDNSHRITIIQGPPGSGKTTVIAAYTDSLVEARRTGIWLIAQSNVAVKNIAEKLAKIGFEPWKLLVSQDFHFDWHDHLYNTISTKVIQSSAFREIKKNPSPLLGCKVILCTLSMLSNHLITTFTSKVPINYLVVDEASQIKVSDYISPLEKFSSIKKLCFIGDDKQLPPYNQGEVKEIQSIFEISHLRSKALLLDIQYRMPPDIGEFISDAVYDGQLRSNPNHLKAGKATCFFVDVCDSIESANGTSWQNKKEADIAIKMAAVLQKNEDSYKIITPYDAQRTLIENRLKSAHLVWQNKCFNVDSFQGNEEDIIICSLVRTNDLGFLEDLRRTNVMLTRCKECLFVISSWDFLMNGPGAHSLVGKMAANMGDESWISLQDIEEENF